MDTWSIVESSLRIAQIKAFDGLCIQGSGYLNVRASFEEGLAGEIQAVSEKAIND